jgi:hypothetical protein
VSEKTVKEFSATTTIHAPAETVWAILTDAAAYPEFDPSCERIEGTIALGHKLRAYTKLSPGRAFPVKVAELVPGEKMKWSGGMPLGLFKGERTFTSTPAADGGVQFTVREVFSGPMLALIGMSIPDMTQPFEQFAAGLKARAESAARR